MVTAALQGRNLVFTVEGLEPFVVRPLPANQGRYVTSLYVDATIAVARATHLGQSVPGEPFTHMNDAMMICVDGGTWDDERQAAIPLPEADRVLWNRLDNEASQSEFKDIMHAAFFWNTVLGIDGVNQYLAEGGGDTGGLKLLGSLLTHMGKSLQLTSPSSESETQTPSQASTPSTPFRRGGPTLAKLPEGKRSWRRKSKKA
jgi:hypothetical protein